MIRTALLAAFCAFLLLPLAAANARVVAVPHAAFFLNIKDGDTVTSPVNIKFGASGVTIAPAGTKTPDTGHFHLLIDTDYDALQKDMPIPADAQHLHYGKGQTEDTVTLSPGKHTLQLVIGDGAHVPLNPPIVSEKITITVK